VAAFRQDLSLVVDNCLTWNLEGSEYYAAALGLHAAASRAFRT
jgi:hypothetical protein